MRREVKEERDYKNITRRSVTTYTIPEVTVTAKPYTKVVATRVFWQSSFEVPFTTNLHVSAKRSTDGRFYDVLGVKFIMQENGFGCVSETGTEVDSHTVSYQIPGSLKVSMGTISHLTVKEEVIPH